MPVKGHDDGNNLHDVYTTNEVLSILQQAIDSGSMQGIDPSINPVVEAVKESHANNNLTFWQGTEDEFNALGISGEILGAKIDSNGKIYVLTGDTTLSDAVANAAAAAQQVIDDKADTSTVNALASAINSHEISADKAVNGTVLYSNDEGTWGSITLSESVNNYDYVRIFYHYSNQYNDVYIPVTGSMQSVILNMQLSGSSSLYYVVFSEAAINGSSVTRVYQQGAFLVSSSGWEYRTTDTNYIRISKIIGYKNLEI